MGHLNFTFWRDALNPAAELLRVIRYHSTTELPKPTAAHLRHAAITAALVPPQSAHTALAGD